MVRITAALLATPVVGQELFLARENLMDDTCSAVYKINTDNCAQSQCERCWNKGARQGVLCRGAHSGYYCPPDKPDDENSDMAFACMDWTFGSGAMTEAESAFASRTGGDSVYFGVGTFGTADDVQNGLGACYRVQVDGVDRDLLVQSINTGHDVSGNQFDLQVGNGGAGLFNTCAGGTNPGWDSMFPGAYDESTWGHQYGGFDNREQCSGLPSHPAQGDPMIAAGDDLVKLCEHSFDKGVRLQGGHNPSILSIGRVECPAELYTMTQIKRSDDPSGYSCGGNCMQATKRCTLSTAPSQGADWCLTRMMDCRKPSGSFKDNIRADVMEDGHRLVQPCTSDGYTRQDNQCGCTDCYC